jgi:alpha-amylase
MPSVCFYFHVHQPFRLKWRSRFDQQSGFDYFDDEKNREIIHKVANKCYLPANQLLLELIEKYAPHFKVSFSISGVAIEQMKLYAPEVLDSFKRLVDSGGVELVAETYYHSLASLYSKSEFAEQVKRQMVTLESVFGQKPTVFRNTELIYSDEISCMVADMGFKAMLAEGADDIMGWRSPNYIYKSPFSDMRIFPKNYKLSDDIAFRFSNRGWAEFPLMADRYASWLHQISGNGQVVNLFMDYETFGEHQWADTGIFDFMRHLPEYVFAKEDWKFNTLSEAMDLYQPVAELSYGRVTSWADLERDTSAWNGNRMQRRALQELYAVSDLVTKSNDPHLLHLWRKLQTSDHFYYMCTKWFSDADVHNYFSHVKNPYEAFIMFMNCLRDFRVAISAQQKPSRTEKRHKVEYPQFAVGNM